MRNRIDQKFADLKSQGKKAFIAYLTAGDPNLTLTEKLVVSFAEHGVDLVEVGVPFSDPMADGPTIQAASQRALERGVTVKKILATVRCIRSKTQIPIALMTYFNPVFHYGLKAFVADAKAAGVDGLIIPDMPPEEGKELMAFARSQGIAIVFFLAPTTLPARMRHVIQKSTGFIYYVSTTGVTGTRQKLPAELLNKVRKAKAMTDKPICVGFGISTAAQVKAIAKVADGVIVGSAIVKAITKDSRRPDMVKRVSGLVSRLAAGLK